MKARVKPGPRPGWGRVDVNDNGVYIIRCSGRPIPAKMARVGRFQTPCLIFPLSGWLRVGDEVEVEPVLECKVCRKHVTALINDLCDDCYIRMCGDMVSPPLVAAIYGGRGR